MPFVGESDVAVKQLDAKQWEVLAQLVYEGKTDKYTVPVGQRTDFASVPRVCIWLLPRYGTYTKAAILHDYLWREMAAKGTMRWSDADGIFRRAMRELGVAFLRRWIMWAAVRIAGLFKRGGRSRWYEEAGPALLFAIVGFVVVAVPAAAILLSLLLFYLLELLFWLLFKLGSAVAALIRPSRRRKRINQPKLRWSL
jgi:hypothetical protein